MSWSQELAKRTVLEACGCSPQSIPMLAAHLINAGIAEPSIYLAARMAVNDLLTDCKIEEFQIHDGPVIYRLPAKTPIEVNKHA